MTKEELVIINAELQNDLITATLKDKELRIEFAKAFNWYEDKPLYGGEKKLIEPTWPQIFVKVGALLERDSKFKISSRLDQVECTVKFLSDKIESGNPNPL